MIRPFGSVNSKHHTKDHSKRKSKLILSGDDDVSSVNNSPSTEAQSITTKVDSKEGAGKEIVKWHLREASMLHVSVQSIMDNLRAPIPNFLDVSIHQVSLSRIDQYKLEFQRMKMPEKIVKEYSSDEKRYLKRNYNETVDATRKVHAKAQL
ncbi:hypothetical protein L1987_27130 [Smallanthus sonchifolius]|uniref:Uncharacterized protein n=1 Tax=Smallanthus sonchifolius TaxID=185202 RepID=A0ACB9IBE8_9ASTR|nr:hypothetical protein L1987_27130 [Smallanthus sonchifolius]